MHARKWMTSALLGAGLAFGTYAHAADNASGEKQSVGEYVSDAAITTKVKAAFVADKSLSALDIAVETNEGTVTLTGTVGNEAQTEQAARVARDVDGVKQVRNDLKVDPAKAK